MLRVFKTLDIWNNNVRRQNIQTSEGTKTTLSVRKQTIRSLVGYVPDKRQRQQLKMDVRE